MVSLTQTTEVQPLPPNTTNQQAELFAVTRALELAADHSLTLYTDSKYVFHILLSHSAI
jgi:ribonuclease HI